MGKGSGGTSQPQTTTTPSSGKGAGGTTQPQTGTPPANTVTGTGTPAPGGKGGKGAGGTAQPQGGAPAWGNRGFGRPGQGTEEGWQQFAQTARFRDAASMEQAHQAWLANKPYGGMTGLASLFTNANGNGALPPGSNPAVTTPSTGAETPAAAGTAAGTPAVTSGGGTMADRIAASQKYWQQQNDWRTQNGLPPVSGQGPGMGWQNDPRANLIQQAYQDRLSGRVSEPYAANVPAYARPYMQQMLDKGYQDFASQRDYGNNNLQRIQQMLGMADTQQGMQGLAGLLGGMPGFAAGGPVSYGNYTLPPPSGPTSWTLPPWGGAGGSAGGGGTGMFGNLPPAPSVAPLKPSGAGVVKYVPPPAPVKPTDTGTKKPPSYGILGNWLLGMIDQAQGKNSPYSQWMSANRYNPSLNPRVNR